MLQIIDRLFKPDACFQDLLQIDFAAYASLGFKMVLLDIDNTLARHGSHQGDEFAREAVRRIYDAGMDCRIISNAAIRRAQQYAASLDLSFTAMANKPSPKALLEACRLSGIPASQAMMVGDQLLTDIAAARQAGCLAILVRPRYEQEAWNVRLKRLLEKTILRRYNAR